MSDNQCKISEAEWLIMDVLWERAPQTATAIIARLKPQTDWSPKTIHSLISRLVGKGALNVDKQASPHQYRPLVTREQCIREEMSSFAKRFFQDSSFLTIANFLQEGRLTVEEIDELKQILDRTKG